MKNRIIKIAEDAAEVLNRKRDVFSDKGEIELRIIVEEISDVIQDNRTRVIEILGVLECQDRERRIRIKLDGMRERGNQAIKMLLMYIFMSDSDVGTSLEVDDKLISVANSDEGHVDSRDLKIEVVAGKRNVKKRLRVSREK